MNASALVVEDDPNTSSGFAKVLSSLGYRVAQASNLAQARQLLKRDTPDVVLLDLALPDGDGLELVSDYRQSDTNPKVVVVTGDRSQESAVKSLRANVHDFVVKPVSLNRLREAVGTAPAKVVESSKSDTASQARPTSVTARDHLVSVGSTPAWIKLRADITHAAAASLHVLLTGETGTDKLAVAQSIHSHSWQRDRFIYFDCANNQVLTRKLTPCTVEHFLTHSAARDLGAETWVFDDVTCLSEASRRQLLGVLGRQSVLHSAPKVSPHCITIERERPADTIPDLANCLAQFRLPVPSLRERKGDLSALCDAILNRLNATYNQRKTLSPASLEAIEAYDWPGNLRQLSDILTRCFVSSDHSLDITGLLPLSDRESQQSKTIECFVGSTFWEVERLLLFATCKHFDGDKKAAAKALGISLKTLYNRLNAYS